MVREEAGTVCTEEEDFVKYVFCKSVLLIIWERTLHMKLLLFRWGGEYQWILTDREDDGSDSAFPPLPLDRSWLISYQQSWSPRCSPPCRRMQRGSKTGPLKLCLVYVLGQELCLWKSKEKHKGMMETKQGKKRLFGCQTCVKVFKGKLAWLVLNMTGHLFVMICADLAGERWYWKCGVYIYLFHFSTLPKCRYKTGQRGGKDRHSREILNL